MRTFSKQQFWTLFETGFDFAWFFSSTRTPEKDYTGGKAVVSGGDSIWLSFASNFASVLSVSA
jgi:hypothetical protein